LTADIGRRGRDSYDGETRVEVSEKSGTPHWHVPSYHTSRNSAEKRLTNVKK